MDLAGEPGEQGIKGFWNFSHYDLSVEYPDVTVENVHLGDSLMSLDTGCGIRKSDISIKRPPCRGRTCAALSLLVDARLREG